MQNTVNTARWAAPFMLLKVDTERWELQLKNSPENSMNNNVKIWTVEKYLG